MRSTNPIHRRRLLGALLAALGLLTWAPASDAAAKGKLIARTVDVIDVDDSNAAVQALADEEPSCTPRENCCKVCRKGKACGNTCIRADYNCHKGVGCACDEEDVCE